MVERSHRLGYWKSLFGPRGSLREGLNVDHQILAALLAEREGGEITEADFLEQCRKLVEASISDQKAGIEASRDLLE